MEIYVVYKNNQEMQIYNKKNLELYLNNGWSLTKNIAVKKTIIREPVVQEVKKSNNGKKAKHTISR